MDKQDIRRLILLALFVSMASVLHVVEGWIPLPLPVPGMKLGLANLMSLTAMVMLGWRAALYVAGGRVLIGSLFGGTLLGPSFAMSAGGALCSVLVMVWAYRKLSGIFSLIGISLLGAAAHNLAQLTIAAALVGSKTMFWYLPYLLLFAVPTGIGTGYTAAFFLSKLPRAAVAMRQEGK